MKAGKKMAWRVLVTGEGSFFKLLDGRGAKLLTFRST